MGHGNRPTTLQERIEISERAQQHQTDVQIAEAMGWKPGTVRKWRRCAQRQGREGLGSKMGRPPTGPLGHASLELRHALRQLRQAHPGWGPETMRLECQKDSRWQGQRLPSRSRIAAFLKTEKLTRRYERHTALQQPPAPAQPAAHAEWEMDAQGVRQVSGIGKVSVINIGDPPSHLRVGSQACPHKAKADTPDYQLGLRRAFLRYGLPQGLSLDHDSAFFDNTSASPYPSQLHLWLIALGLAVRFIDVGRPTQHGFIERTHPLVEQQALHGRDFSDPTALQQALDQRLDFLNQAYPSRSCAGQPPLRACPEARHSGRPYRPEWECRLLDLQRVYAYLAHHRWFRQVTAAGQFTLGQERYGLGKAWGQQTIEIHFEAQTQEFICQAADGQAVQRLKAKGLTAADLMGEFQMEHFPHYQYAFPWSPEIDRLNLLYAEMSGTTL